MKGGTAALPPNEPGGLGLGVSLALSKGTSVKGSIRDQNSCSASDTPTPALLNRTLSASQRTFRFRRLSESCELALWKPALNSLLILGLPLERLKPGKMWFASDEATAPPLLLETSVSTEPNDTARGGARCALGGRPGPLKGPACRPNAPRGARAVSAVPRGDPPIASSIEFSACCCHNLFTVYAMRRARPGTAKIPGYLGLGIPDLGSCA